MSNTSATGGFLSPEVSPSVLDDTALTDFLQSLVVGIAGIPGNMVRPRWQAEPANIPAYGQNWAAIGIQNRTPETYAYFHRVVSGNTEYDELKRHELLHILVSFYGPNAESNCSIFRDGLQIPQNLEAMALKSFGLVETGEPINVPSLVKERWLMRVDLPFVVRHQLIRHYAVESLAAAKININNEHYTETINLP